MTKEYLHRRKIDMQKMIRIVLLIIYDSCSVLLSSFLALMVRFDFHITSISSEYLHNAYRVIPFTILFTIALFSLLHLYNSLWEYVSVREMYYTVIGSVIVTLFQTGLLMLNDLYSVPRSYHLIFLFIFIAFNILGRFSYRFLRLAKREYLDAHKKEKIRVMLIGAGQAGRLIIDEIKHSEYTSQNIVCIIDDDPFKKGKYIRNIPIVGGREFIKSAVEKYKVDQIIITIPSISRSKQKELLDVCQSTGCEVKILPGIYQLINGEVNVQQLRNVEIDDLLGRDPIKVNSEEIFSFIQNKVILVTGGGGSIGSELCRQIAAHNPKQLIIFDIYENNAYNIQLELKSKYPELNLETIIGSVRDSRKVWKVFETYKPDVVYHAAAHKHVPLMEDSPCEAIKNNVIGTYKTAYAAMVHHCKRFVLISTDKAVNPTNIMGASKRLCEMVIQSFDSKIKTHTADELPQLFTHVMPELDNIDSIKEALRTTETEFVAVRFGNVLGSNGSVIPLFKKQIEAGGPVTVTHPDIIRFFMTIPEAVSLVLQAGVYANSGTIYVLDMGEPVKIVDLARNLIRLSGYKDDEIEIVFTGLRPGEKLYEEKLMAEEGLSKTENDLIHIGNPIKFDENEFLVGLQELMVAAYKNKDDIRDNVQSIVSTYHPANN